jgi:hypothetical protein
MGAAAFYQTARRHAPKSFPNVFSVHLQKLNVLVNITVALNTSSLSGLEAGT